MRNTILISLLLTLLPVSVSAQFYTITRDSEILSTERQKEAYKHVEKDVTEGKKNKMMSKDTLIVGPDNQKKLEDKFHEVKQYLEDHPGASVEQTATDNDISTKQIRQWVKEERLILSSATEAGIVCEKCGKPIRTGRFCDKCKERMANEFQHAYQKPEPKMEDLRSTRDRDRMRYLKNE